MPDKLISTISLLAASVGALVIMTAVAVLSDLSAPSPDVRIADLESGSLARLLTGPTLWNRFPSIPPLTAMFDALALCVVAGMTAGVCCWLRGRLKNSLGLMSLLVLCSSSVPYLWGWIELQSRVHDPVEVGAWIAFMLLGACYCCLIAAFLALLDLVRPRHRRAGTEEPLSVELNSIASAV